MKSIIMYLLNINLSVAEFFFTTQFNISQIKSLQTFKAVLITECLIKCKQTSNCKDVVLSKERTKNLLIAIYLQATIPIIMMKTDSATHGRSQ